MLTLKGYLSLLFLSFRSLCRNALPNERIIKSILTKMGEQFGDEVLNSCDSCLHSSWFPEKMASKTFNFQKNGLCVTLLWQLLHPQMNCSKQCRRQS